MYIVYTQQHPIIMAIYEYYVDHCACALLHQPLTIYLTHNKTGVWFALCEIRDDDGAHQQYPYTTPIIQLNQIIHHIIPSELCGIFGLDISRVKNKEQQQHKKPTSKSQMRIIALSVWWMVRNRKNKRKIAWFWLNLLWKTSVLYCQAI